MYRNAASRVIRLYAFVTNRMSNAIHIEWVTVQFRLLNECGRVVLSAIELLLYIPIDVGCAFTAKDVSNCTLKNVAIC